MKNMQILAILYLKIELISGKIGIGIRLVLPLLLGHLLKAFAHLRPFRNKNFLRQVCRSLTCPGWPQIWYFPASASQSATVISMYHHAQCKAGHNNRMCVCAYLLYHNGKPSSLFVSVSSFMK